MPSKTPVVLALDLGTQTGWAIGTAEVLQLGDARLTTLSNVMVQAGIIDATAAASMLSPTISAAATSTPAAG